MVGEKVFIVDLRKSIARGIPVQRSRLNMARRVDCLTDWAMRGK